MRLHQRLRPACSVCAHDSDIFKGEVRSWHRSRCSAACAPNWCSPSSLSKNRAGPLCTAYRARAWTCHKLLGGYVICAEDLMLGLPDMHVHYRGPPPIPYFNVRSLFLSTVQQKYQRRWIRTGRADRTGKTGVAELCRSTLLGSPSGVSTARHRKTAGRWHRSRAHPALRQ